MFSQVETLHMQLQSPKYPRLQNTGDILMPSYSISVITTTWNEEENIKELIPLIRNALNGTPHEIIVVDDDSQDGTVQAAKGLADIVVSKKREGQTKGLLHGMKLAKHPIIVTIDADLENDPKYIQELLNQINDFGIIVASRTKLPRLLEKIASKTLGNIIGVKDVFSNFRAYKIETVSSFELKGGETFGGELLVIAKKKGFKIGEIFYESVRRKNPRIGGTLKANLRIFWALIKSLLIYVI
jgi:dolichol-phosphate mannosyltransferase